MEIIKTTALITINETLWVQLIGFLIFLFLINRVMFRPVRRNLAEREAHFNTLKQDILALKVEMTTLFKETEAEEHQLKTTARRIGEDLRQEGQQEAKRLMHKALDEIKVLQQQAAHHLNASMDNARQQVASEAEGLRTSIIGHLMNRRP